MFGKVVTEPQGKEPYRTAVLGIDSAESCVFLDSFERGREEERGERRA